MEIAVGLAGAGRRAAEVHAPSIASCPGLLFAGVWARSPEAARELAERHDVPASVRAHGDPSGWVGLMLEHLGGRFSEASLYATEDVGWHRADVEVFGPGGVASVGWLSRWGGTRDTMIAEFAEAVIHNAPHPLDVHHGLHLQQAIEAADTALLAGQ